MAMMVCFSYSSVACLQTNNHVMHAVDLSALMNLPTSHEQQQWQDLDLSIDSILGVESIQEDTESHEWTMMDRTGRL